jgi:hypothetical protein
MLLLSHILKLKEESVVLNMPLESIAKPSPILIPPNVVSLATGKVYGELEELETLNVPSESILNPDPNFTTPATVEEARGTLIVPH